MIRHYEKGDCERLLKQPHQSHEDNRDFMFDHEDTIVIEDDDKALERRGIETNISENIAGTHVAYLQKDYPEAVLCIPCC